MTQPLEKLLKNEMKYKWNKEQDVAFERIKQAFEKAPDLFLIRQEYNFGIYVDAADSGLRSMLFQYNMYLRAIFSSGPKRSSDAIFIGSSGNS